MNTSCGLTCYEDLTCNCGLTRFLIRSCGLRYCGLMLEKRWTGQVVAKVGGRGPGPRGARGSDPWPRVGVEGEQAMRQWPQREGVAMRKEWPWAGRWPWAMGWPTAGA